MHGGAHYGGFYGRGINAFDMKVPLAQQKMREKNVKKMLKLESYIVRFIKIITRRKYIE